MKKTNGFTLIELLAVIAILAVILLIAVPLVLSTINSSRDSSLKSSAMMVWDAAETCVAMNTVNSTLCTLPTLHATIAGYAGFTNISGVPAGKTTAPASAAGNWTTIGSLSGFSGTYMVEFNINASTIYRVYVSNDTSHATTTFSAPTQRTCYISAKNGSCTFAG